MHARVGPSILIAAGALMGAAITLEAREGEPPANVRPVIERHLRLAEGPSAENLKQVIDLLEAAPSTEADDGTGTGTNTDASVPHVDALIDKLETYQSYVETRPGSTELAPLPSEVMAKSDGSSGSGSGTGQSTEEEWFEVRRDINSWMNANPLPSDWTAGTSTGSGQSTR